MSLEELLATLDAIKRKEEREFKFHAALQGVDLDGGSNGPNKSFEEVWKEADPVRDLPEPQRLAHRGISYETVNG